MRIAALLCAAGLAHGYPLDGVTRTGIRRLTGYKALMKLPPGAYLNSDQVKLRMAGVNENYDITPQTPKDPKLQAGLEAIFATRDPSYHIAILDITDPAAPRYAALRADQKYIPGSVGKLMVATGLFGQLRRMFPETAAREKYLRETIVTADSFVHRDGKTVPFFNPGDPKITNRRLEIGDRFNVYEWLDHMLSQSSNAAASTVWKHAMIMANPEAFRQLPKPQLAKLSLEALEPAISSSGLDTNKLRIGTFFTSGGSSVVPGTASYATPNELLRWLVKLEQGKLVDPWSSLEIKRLLYFSRPRYRYASSPSLNSAAVYFKSGSLFECEPEPGYRCLQYRGNKMNLMHSVAVVESGTKTYLVALMSNVLRLNSAVEHQTIAALIEKLISAR